MRYFKSMMAVFGMLVAANVCAAPAAKPAAAPTTATAAGMTVAVFDFRGREPSLSDGGRLAAALVRTKLGNGGLRVVSREEMSKIIEEQKLKIAGVTDEASPRTGMLLGAQILVTGEVFDAGGRYLITAKAIATETGRVWSDSVTCDRTQVEPAGQALGEKMLALINRGAPYMLAKVKLSGEQLGKLKQELGDGPMPRVFVAIRERVISRPVPDPAAQTEFGFILRKTGADVVKDNAGTMKDWVQDYSSQGSHSTPPKSFAADVVIVGEAFSESATHVGELISSRARVEIEAIDIKTGKVLAIDRETAAATDVSEAVAAKSALQETAARLAYRMLPEAIQGWRRAHPVQQSPAKGDAATTKALGGK